MQDQINQLKKQVEDLQNKLVSIERANNYTFVGNLSDAIVEKVIIADTTGGTAPAPTVSGVYVGNSLAYQQALTGAAQDIKVLNVPSQILIYKWKGQRLAIPVYPADDIIYP